MIVDRLLEIVAVSATLTFCFYLLHKTFDRWGSHGSGCKACPGCQEEKTPCRKENF